MIELQAKEYQAVQAAHARDGGWAASRGLGSGGQGVVSAWINIDEHGRIRERIAVKDTYLDDKDEWEDTYPLIQFTEWKAHIIEAGALTAFHNLNAQPRKEFVQSPQGLVNNPIIDIRDYREFVPEGFFRMALEYCPFGDLEELCNSYLEEGRVIPEPFIWCLFAHLADAALLMEQGDLRHSVTGWRTIVHRDMKTANVFLGEGSSSEYSLFPVPKLGDFGLTYVISPAHEAYNNGGGTEASRSPEALENSYVEMTTKTNVYGVGLIVLNLMTLDDSIGMIYLDLREPPPVEDSLPYSDTLKNLVRRCVTWGPARRIDVQTLRKEIQQATSGPGEHTNGYRYPSQAVANGYAASDAALLIRRDKYAVNLALPPETPLPTPGNQEGEASDGDDLNKLMKMEE
nr:hypothetical protein B0A51_08252 [Rachicladosporium sp. CCFEE 5018]